MKRDYNTKIFLEPAVKKEGGKSVRRHSISEEDIKSLKKLLKTNSQELWKYLQKKGKSQAQR